MIHCTILGAIEFCNKCVKFDYCQSRATQYYYYLSLQGIVDLVSFEIENQGLRNEDFWNIHELELVQE